LSVIEAFNAAHRAGFLSDLSGCGLGASGIAGSNDDLLAGAGPTQRQP
jgi:hypothetical protein